MQNSQNSMHKNALEQQQQPCCQINGVLCTIRILPLEHFCRVVNREQTTNLWCSEKRYVNNHAGRYPATLTRTWSISHKNAPATSKCFTIVWLNLMTSIWPRVSCQQVFYRVRHEFIDKYMQAKCKTLYILEQKWGRLQCSIKFLFWNLSIEKR